MEKQTHHLFTGRAWLKVQTEVLPIVASRKIVFLLYLEHISPTAFTAKSKASFSGDILVNRRNIHHIK